MKKIVVIPDSFKGTISSLDFCRIAETLIRRKAIPFSEARLRSAQDLSHTLEDVIRFSKIFRNSR